MVSMATTTIMASIKCMFVEVMKMRLSFSLSPAPNPYVMKRDAEDVSEPEMSENIETRPPTTLFMP